MSSKTLFLKLSSRHARAKRTIACCCSTCNFLQPISIRLGLEARNNYTIPDLYDIARKQQLSFEDLITIPGT